MSEEQARYGEESKYGEGRRGLSVMHRIKAIESYEALDLMIDKGLTYPAYMMLKEGLRSVLTYINESKYNKEYSTKTKLKTVMAESVEDIAAGVHLRDFDMLLELEEGGLERIISTEAEELRPMKSALKKIIHTYIVM